MKKDKLYPEKFIEGQEIIIKIARKYKNGTWTNYTPDDDYIVDKITDKSIKVHHKKNKLNVIEITDESIKTGVVRIVKANPVMSLPKDMIADVTKFSTN